MELKKYVLHVLCISWRPCFYLSSLFPSVFCISYLSSLFPAFLLYFSLSLVFPSCHARPFVFPSCPLYFLLVFFTSCWSSLFPAGPLYFLLDLFISCWSCLFPAGPVYFLLVLFKVSWIWWFVLVGLVVKLFGKVTPLYSDMLVVWVMVYL